MPQTYLGKVQKSKHRQDLLYQFLKGQMAEKGKTMQELAVQLDETKQNFSQKFNRKTLQPWELLIVFHELDIELEQLVRYEL